MSNIESLNKFPIRFEPAPDEILSSWISRLAICHGLNGSDLARSLWTGNPFGYKGIDVDRQSNKQIFKTLALKTGISEKQIIDTSLISYCGYLFENIPEMGRISWVMPWQVTNAMKRFSTQCCIDCLREDEFPYFRKHWRLSFVTTCTKHRKYLTDRCPYCCEPIMYYWVESKSIDRQVLPLSVCKNCKLDYREYSHTNNEKKPDAKEISFQQHLEDTLKKGWVELNGDIVYSHLYFDGMHFLMSHLSSKSGRKLRKAICDEYAIEEISSPDYLERMPAEMQSITERSRLINLISPLLTDWSSGFVRLCASRKIWSSALLSGWRLSNAIPYWLWRVLEEYLSRPIYKYSEQEIDSIVNYVTNNSMINGKKILTKLFGDSVYRKLLERGSIPPKIKVTEDRKCIRCGAVEKQHKAGKRPDGNYRFYCGMCNKTYTPVPMIHPLSYPQKVKDQALQMKEKGLTFKQIAKNLSINRMTAQKWYRQSRNKVPTSIDKSQT